MAITCSLDRYVANHSLMPSYATTRGITAHYGYCTTNAANPYLEAQ